MLRRLPRIPADGRRGPSEWLARQDADPTRLGIGEVYPSVRSRDDVLRAAGLGEDREAAVARRRTGQIPAAGPCDRDHASQAIHERDPIVFRRRQDGTAVRVLADAAELVEAGARRRPAVTAVRADGSRRREAGDAG